MDSGREPDLKGNFMDVVLRPVNLPPPREQLPISNVPVPVYGGNPHKHLPNSNYSQIESVEHPDVATSQILEKLRNSGFSLGGQSVPAAGPSLNTEYDQHFQQEIVDSLRMNNTHLKKENEFLKKENEKKEFLIQDLLKKLHDSIETIRSQSDQIHKLQQFAGENAIGEQTETKFLGQIPTHPVASNNTSFASNPLLAVKDEKFKVPAPKAKSEQSTLELRVTTQPPSQAVYQRILRPFPSVTINGFNSATMCNNLFVEVNLLTQTDNDHVLYSNVLNTKQGRVEDDKKALMIGGQRVQRSEVGSSPDTLVVVFRKLKILTTTAQQGGAFFLLQFVLKRYVDNTFETVDGVACAISQPIEVFSHTLYLKGRPSASTGVTHTAKKAKKEPKDSKNNLAEATAAQALMLQANASIPDRVIVPQSVTTIPKNTPSYGYDHIEVKDALSTLVAASVDAQVLPP